MSFTGTELKRFDAAAQNVTGSITGIDFDATGKLLVATTWNVVYKVDPAFSPLRLAGGSFVMQPKPLEYLSARDVERTRQRAIEFWSTAGLPFEFINRLQAITIQVVAMQGGYLGLGSSETILLDDDGAGIGWDLGTDDHVWDSRVDLLSVVLHEMGHVLGLDDEEYAERGTLMFDELEIGERRRPSSHDVDEIMSRLS
jgi:hypothetical protein